MKNKNLKKAVALGTMSAVSLTTIVNPIAGAYADVEQQGSTEEEASTTTTSDDAKSETETVNVNEDREYTIEDIGLSASLTDGVTLDGTSLSYIRGSKEGINIAATVLDGSIDIQEVRLHYEGTDVTDSLRNGENSSSLGGVIEFSARENLSVSGFTLSVVLSNGQVVNTDLKTLINSLSSVKTLKANKITSSDLTYSASLTGKAKLNNGNIYYTGSDAGVMFSVESKVPNTRVASISLDVNTDGDVKNILLEDGVVNLSSLAGLNLAKCKLRVNVEDAQGLENSIDVTSYKELSAILGLGEFSNIIKDTTAPAISYVSSTVETKSYKDKSYIIKDGILTFKAVDNKSGLSNVSSIKIKDTDTDVIHTYNKTDGTITINTNQFANGSHTFIIQVEDALGNSSAFEYSIKVQKSAPIITGYSHSNAMNESGTSYINDSLDIYVGASTDEMLNKIQLYKDGSLYAESTSKSTKFTIDDGGSYKIVVSDVLGNSKTYKLSELFSDLNDNIVLDTSKPTCKTDVNGAFHIGKWYTGLKSHLTFTLSDNLKLKKAKITINGKEHNYQLNKDEAVLDIPFSSLEKSKDGKYTIEVEATDIAGNVYKLKPFDVYFTSTKPTIDLSVQGNFVESNNKVYVDGNVIVGKENKCFDVSGIKSIELLKDDEVISDKLPFVISDSGEYKIRVTNNVGLSTTKSLSDLMGTISNEVIMDNSAPVLKREEGFKPDKQIDGVNWYKSEPTFKIKVSEANLKSFTGIVKGCESYTADLKGDYLTIKTKGIEGKATLLVTAVDCYGHTTVDEYSYCVDTKSPEITSAHLSEEYIERGGKLYFQSTPTISIESSDGGSGVESYNLTGDKTETNSTGVFTLGSGKYFIEIKDKLGNTTGKKPLSEVLSLPSNNLVVDDEAPTINATRPNGAKDNWYSKDFKYPIELKDNVGIKSAIVYINNQVVEEHVIKDTDDVKSLKVYADTSRVEPDENGLYQIRVDVLDKSNNLSSWSDAFYIDKTAPTVDKFIFTGDGSQEGVNINGTSRYGFFFKGKATCEIHVSDGDISSGLDTLHVTFENQDGTTTKKDVDASKGYAVVQVPNNFKGFISAYAEDKVGHKGDVGKPDGVITEDGNCFINNLKLEINLPETNSYDISGTPLYSKDIVATAEIGCGFSGIKKINWGIGDETLGNVEVDSEGNTTGDLVRIKQMGKNLVLSLSDQLSLKGNSNGEKVWVSVTDRAGHTSTTSRKFSIDKDAPIIDVSYNTSVDNGYYAQTRTATISVNERNFDASKFTVSGSSGTLGNWSNRGGIWYNTITFSEDGEYQFSLDCVDRVGNVAKTYSSEKFTIDKTAPVLSVNWNNDSPNNGNFYKDTRIATVTVVEKNFDASRFALTGSGSLSNWSNSGDTHTATISFDADGEYEFSISGEDLAGNKSETYSSGKFIVDKTVPTLEISGVQNGVSYKKDVGLSVKITDAYIDTSATSITLKGKRNGDLRLDGYLNEKTGELYFKNFPKDEKYDDIYTLKANVVDKAGNTVQQNLAFSVNRFGSKYEFANASMLNTYLNKAQDVEIVESNVDKLEVDRAKVSIILDGNESKVDKDLISVTESNGKDGKYNYSYKIDKKAFKTDGKYLIQIYSHATEGTNYNSVSEEYSFVLDTVKPTIIVSGIKSDSDYNEYEKNVTIDVRDMSGVKDIEVNLNGKSITPDKENGVYSFKVGEKSSTQNLSVTVTDLAGNTSTSEVNNFLVTSNFWVYIFNQLWFRVSIGALIAFISAIIALLIRNNRKARRQEDEILRQNMELYRASSSTSTGSSSSEKDMVEDLEEKSDN